MFCKFAFCPKIFFISLQIFACLRQILKLSACKKPLAATQEGEKNNNNIRFLENLVNLYLLAVTLKKWYNFFGKRTTGNAKKHLPEGRHSL